jgi:hypothetical protein
VIAQALPAEAGYAQALIGYYGHEGATVARIPIDIRLRGLSRIVKTRRIHIKAIQIPDVGAETLVTLPVAFSVLLDVTDDQVSFSLDGLPVHEACAIRIEEV